MKNKVQLITYPDSMGGDIASLALSLEESFPGLFEGGIHILPPFPSSGDRGFAPLTYLEIDPAFGSWEDVADLAKQHDIVLDLMVNHISSRSRNFQDFIEHGRESEWADLFITLDKYWPGGKPEQDDIDRMFLRRPLPYSTFEVGRSHRKEAVWTTFGKEDPSEQIDLDWRSPMFRRLVTGILAKFAEHGARIVRLDAVGYVVKKLGTSCFFVEPEIYEFLAWIKAAADEHEITLLPEVHARRDVQESLAAHGYWTYDFILPYLVLDAMLSGSFTRLKPFLLSRHERQVTMLDCHDGVPVKPDVEGMYGPVDVRNLVGTCLARGANLSLVYSDQHKDPDGFDVHQIRGTYYSLLGCDDDLYIAARAIQLFVPGIPQIYYVGLLAGENDAESVARNGDGREIHRHNYSRDEIRSAARRPVVQRLVGLIRLRNSDPSFDGEFQVLEGSDRELRLRWTKDGHACTLDVDMRSGESRVTVTDGSYGDSYLL